MLHLETLINETAADPDFIELNCFLEDNNISQIPNGYKTLATKLTHRWCIVMVDDRIIVAKTLPTICNPEPTFRSSRDEKCVLTQQESGGRKCEQILRRNQKHARHASSPERT